MVQRLVRDNSSRVTTVVTEQQPSCMLGDVNQTEVLANNCASSLIRKVLYRRIKVVSFSSSNDDAYASW